MNIVYLLPPSEGKNSTPVDYQIQGESLSFAFEKPVDIAVNATEKDLKCTGKRYEEGRKLNMNIQNQNSMSAISRYSGVMYNAINYRSMGQEDQKYFESHFLILSGMYGILRPTDLIANYKLPIETKGLYLFWGSKITDAINRLQADLVVDLLPKSYKKMLLWNQLRSKLLRVDFYNAEGEKLTHGVKKIKGEYVRNISKIKPVNIEDFLGEKVQISQNEYHISVIL